MERFLHAGAALKLAQNALTEERSKTLNPQGRSYLAYKTGYNGLRISFALDAHRPMEIVAY
jgi:hypothetical protein